MLRWRRTISDDGDSLPRQIIAPVPAGGMHHLSLEVFQAGDLRLAREVELANGRNQKVRMNEIGVCELAVLLSADSDAGVPF